jgi:asparagine synthetase B (glutamine-hydrolysing)
MCGIAGFHGTPDLELPAQVVLRRMINVLRYRGPDERDRVALARDRSPFVNLSLAPSS